MANKIKTEEEITQEILDLNNQFSEFLHTKGISKKFRLAFSNMGDAAHKQHEIDKANFAEEKARAIEENNDFYDFLHTKGLKGKYHLVIENIKKGARESGQKTASQLLLQELKHNKRLLHLECKQEVKLKIMIISQLQIYLKNSMLF